MKGIRKLRDLSRGFRAIVFLTTPADLAFTSLWSAIGQYCEKFHHYPDGLIMGKKNTFKPHGGARHISVPYDWTKLEIVTDASFDEDEWAVVGPLGVVFSKGA